MNKLLIIFFSFLLLAPLTADAQSATTVNACDPGTIECSCDTAEETLSVNPGSITTTDSCESSCAAYVESGYDILSYNLSCKISGTLTPITAGNIVTHEEANENTAGTTRNKESPVLGIKIPGLTFSDAYEKDGNLYVNYLGEYIAAVYKWLIGAAALIAVVMFMIAGLQWMLARGNASGIEQAKERMRNATLGIVLLLGAYSIAYFIDPNTTAFEPLTIRVIEPMNLPDFGEPGADPEVLNAPDVPIPEGFVEVSGTYIANLSSGGRLITPPVLTDLQKASEAFNEATGKNVWVTSAARTLQSQATLFYDNCLANSQKKCDPPTCNPAHGSTVITKTATGAYALTGELEGVTDKNTIINGLVEHGKTSNCPHTSGIGIDAWCEGSGDDFAYDPTCQYELMRAMLDHGFCRLGSEPWHFEYTPMSIQKSSCSSTLTATYYHNGKSHTPTNGCTKWSYREDKCLVE